MKRHVKNYLRYFKLGDQDTILCEVCTARAVDLHHIEFKGMGGQKKNAKKLDSIENIIALCRNCHIKAHAGNFSKGYLMKLHLKKL